MLPAYHLPGIAFFSEILFILDSPDREVSDLSLYQLMGALLRVKTRSQTNKHIGAWPAALDQPQNSKTSEKHVEQHKPNFTI
jgi:hypothetical protein